MREKNFLLMKFIIKIKKQKNQLVGWKFLFYHAFQL